MKACVQFASFNGTFVEQLFEKARVSVDVTWEDEMELGN